MNQRDGKRMHFRKISCRSEPRWEAPVQVRITRWRLETIDSPAEALDKLISGWPGRRGRHYRSAVTNCEAAVSCQYSSELAREAFLRASLEAAILADAGEPLPRAPVRVPAARLPLQHCRQRDAVSPASG
jgi:hypothetical protein